MSQRKRHSGAPSPKPHAAAIERLPARPGFVFRPPACTFGLGVTGDCMEPFIFEGDTLIIDPFLDPAPGQIVIFECARRMFVKKLVSAGDGLALIPVNDPSMYFPVDERVYICGVATALNFAIPDPHYPARQRANGELWARFNAVPPTAVPWSPDAAEEGGA